MHLLFVALNFHPDRLGNAPIITDLAAGLVQRGHRVSVVCAMPHHETGAIDPTEISKDIIKCCLALSLVKSARETPIVRPTKTFGSEAIVVPSSLKSNFSGACIT